MHGKYVLVRIYLSISISFYISIVFLFCNAFVIFYTLIPLFVMHRGAYIGFVLGGLAMAFGSIIFLTASPLQRGCRDLKGPEYTFFEKASSVNFMLMKATNKFASATFHIP